MWMETRGIIGVGYEGRQLDGFIADLVSWRVGLVVDVRLNAISRKKGFSKRALARALEESGIRYLHLPELGNPKGNRDGFWNPGTPEAQTAHQAYRRAIDCAEGKAAIDRLVDEASHLRIAVLCFEASERCCHRSLVLDAVKEQAGNLQPT